MFFFMALSLSYSSAFCHFLFHPVKVLDEAIMIEIFHIRVTHFLEKNNIKFHYEVNFIFLVPNSYLQLTFQTENCLRELYCATLVWLLRGPCHEMIS